MRKTYDPPAPSMPPLGKSALEFLREHGREIFYPPNTTILHQGDPAQGLFVVLSGEVEARLVKEKGSYLSLAKMKEGQMFGEMSLLRNAPISADITALTPVTVLHYPAVLFRAALSECEPLRDEILANLARKLQATSSGAWSFFQRAEALNMLIHMDSKHPPLTAESSKMQAVAKEIKQLAKQSVNILIQGDTGTGKLLAAKMIHESQHSETAPFIVVDCGHFKEQNPLRLLFGVDRIEEMSSLQGRYGALHLAHGGTLILQHAEELDGGMLDIIGRYLHMRNHNEEEFLPRPRIIATLVESSVEATHREHILEALRPAVVRLPRLSERKADILPLAKQFLSERYNEGEKILTRDAEHALLNMPYFHRNVSELREVVESAAIFADGAEIHEEHLFAGPKDEKLPLEYCLEEVSLIRRLIKGNAPLKVMRAVVLVSFVSIALACILFANTLTGRIANALIWGVWEPLLILSFLLFGHLWCSICPLSTMGRTVQRRFSFKRPPPVWLKKWSIWLATVGFFVIIWSERVYHMIDNPVPSGILLLTLILSATTFCIIFNREAWCRYVCPLGFLASSYSLPAMLHVRAKPNVCATFCKSHPCFKGSDAGPGCPMFHHPIYVSKSFNCKLCFTCLKTCPHGSVRLYLRPILQSIWVIGGDWSKALVPFFLVVFFLSIISLASQRLPYLSGPMFTAVSLPSFLLAAILYYFLRRFLLDKRSPGDTVVAKVSSALLVLAWGPFMAYQVGNIPEIESLRVQAAAGTAAQAQLPWLEIPVLSMMQVSLILTAVLLASYALWRIRTLAEEEERLKVNPWAWHLLGAFCACYTAAALTLVFV